MAQFKDKKTLKSFGLHVQNIRKSKGVTQAQLAADCNMEISQISRIERGVINTSVLQVILIANNLNIAPKDLFDFDLK